MRAALLGAVLAAVTVPALATPASAAQEIVYVRSTESGVGVGVNVGTGHIAGAAVFYSGAACVSIGMADRICTSG